MSAPTNHWKLGLFVVVGFCTALATVVFLSARSLQKVTVEYLSYFDESIQGLEVGSPVKFRGVTIGNVSRLGVAPDHRHVEVACALGVKDLHALGLSIAESRGKDTKMKLPPDLRVQLETAGLTGVKFILIDYFSLKDFPLPKLPFTPPENYIPSAPSMMKNLEDSVVRATDKFPELAEKMLKVLLRIDTILTDIERQKLPSKIAVTLGNVDQVLLDAHQAVNQLEVGKLSGQASATLANLNLAIANVNTLISRIGAETGVMASAQRTLDHLDNITQNATHVAPALEDTLRQIQGAAESIQRLADSLDRDPDMLLKGRAKRPTP